MKGNGTTVYNRAQEENGDYKNIAHISDKGDITYYHKHLPGEVIREIKRLGYLTRINLISQTTHKKDNSMPMIIKGIKFYNVKEVAQILQVSIPTVRNYYKNGRLKGQRIGAPVYIPETSITEYLKPSLGGDEAKG